MAADGTQPKAAFETQVSAGTRVNGCPTCTDLTASHPFAECLLASSSDFDDFDIMCPPCVQIRLRSYTNGTIYPQEPDLVCQKYKSGGRYITRSNRKLDRVINSDCFVRYIERLFEFMKISNPLIARYLTLLYTSHGDDGIFRQAKRRQDLLEETDEDEDEDEESGLTITEPDQLEDMKIRGHSAMNGHGRYDITRDEKLGSSWANAILL